MGFCKYIRYGMLLLAPLRADVPFPDPLIRQLDSLDRQEQDLTSAREALNDTAARYARELERLRETAGTGLSPFARRRRDRLLAGAKTASDSLTRLERELGGVTDRQRGILARLTTGCARLLDGDAAAEPEERCRRLLPGWRERLVRLQDPAEGRGEGDLEAFSVQDTDDLFALQRKLEMLTAYARDVDRRRGKAQRAVEDLRFDIRVRESDDRFSRPDDGFGSEHAGMPSGTGDDIYPLEIRLRDREEELRALDSLRQRIGTLEAAITEKITHLTE